MTMRHCTWLPAALLAVFVSPAAAQDAPVDQPARIAKLTQLFTDVCLKAYPDRTAVEAVAAGQRSLKLSPAEATRMLMGMSKSGSGWTVIDNGLFAILIGDGPKWEDKSCTIMTVGPSGMAVHDAFETVKKEYAAGKGKAFSPPETMPMRKQDLWETQMIGWGAGFSYIRIDAGDGSAQHRLVYSPGLIP